MNVSNASHSSPSPERDHRALIQAMDLAHIEQHSPGMVFWHPAGVKVLRRLEKMSLALHESEDYQEVRSPALLSQSLWERSGHWDKYRAGMFVVEPGEGPDDRPMALKPMSCPGHISIFQSKRRSYRELPFKLFEFGSVHRNELSGALSGFLRLRSFVQDDAHVFAAVDGLENEIAGFVRMVEKAYPEFGFERWSYRLALRPDQRAGDEALWDKSEQALRNAVKKMGLVAEEAPGEGAFYGPKLEVVLEDRLGRSWQCGVIQVDFVLPERFGLGFINEAGEEEQPVLLHHAVLGSLERWLSIVLEHHGALPDGLAPYPVGVFPVSDRSDEAARTVWEKLKSAGVPAYYENRGPLGGRLRDAAEALIPYWAVIGPRDAAAGQVHVRKRGEAKGKDIPVDLWVEQVAQAWHAGLPLAPGMEK